MSLTKAYQTIQWMIAKEVLELLRYDGEKTLKEWADKREKYLEDINLIVLNVLGLNRQRILDEVTSAYAEAEQLIAEHIEEQWGFTDVEHDTLPQAEATVRFLNENVVRGLYSDGNHIGAVERTVADMLNEARETELQGDDELVETLSAIVFGHLQDGFYSGFIQSDGLQWRMDRYVNQISKHIYQDTYTRAMQEVLFGKGVELVKIHRFIRPRDACTELQESGVICIVPKAEASASSLQYPNIWDAKHRYTQPGGHHGSDGNCRHVWHSLDSEADQSDRLYNRINEMLLNLELQRLAFNQNVRQYLGRW